MSTSTTETNDDMWELETLKIACSNLKKHLAQMTTISKYVDRLSILKVLEEDEDQCVSVAVKQMEVYVSELEVAIEKKKNNQ